MAINVLTKIIVWMFRLSIPLRIMLYRQKGLCKQCFCKIDTSRGGRPVCVVKPNALVSIVWKLYGVFCSNECEEKYIVIQRQKLETHLGHRVAVVNK